MRLKGFFKAYMLDLNALMNVTPKMDNLVKKCIFLVEKKKIGGGHVVQVPKPFEETGIIKIAKGVEIDGLKRKSGRASPQKASAKICPEARRPNKFGLLYQHKKQAKGTNFQQRWHLRRKITQCWKRRR
jgi:hypothetical protein